MSIKQKKKTEFFLIQNALCGDQKAYKQLFEKYYKILHYQLNKYLRDEDATADLCMETFEKAFNSLHNYIPEYAFSTWLIRIGLNMAIDYNRARKRHSFVRIDTDEDDDDAKFVFQLKDEADTPLEGVMNVQYVDFVKRMIEELPRWHRRMLELKYLDGLTYEEIADELQVPVGTVKGTLHRAKELFQEILKNNKEE